MKHPQWKRATLKHSSSNNIAVCLQYQDLGSHHLQRILKKTSKHSREKRRRRGCRKNISFTRKRCRIIWLTFITSLRPYQKTLGAEANLLHPPSCRAMKALCQPRRKKEHPATFYEHTPITWKTSAATRTSRSMTVWISRLMGFKEKTTIPNLRRKIWSLRQNLQTPRKEKVNHWIKPETAMESWSR